MQDFEGRLAALERSNRRLKMGVMALTATLGCGILMAAGGGDVGAYDQLLVRNKLVVGQEGQPAVVVESQKDLAAVSISTNENKQKIVMAYRPKTGATAILVFDANGDAAIEAKHLEAGLNEKPITTVSLAQPADKGGLFLVSAPGGRTGVVVQDQEGRSASRLDRNGATSVGTATATVDPDAAARKRFAALLSNSRSLMKKGLRQAAEKNLKRIVKEAPGTSIAAEAQRELDRLANGADK